MRLTAVLAILLLPALLSLSGCSGTPVDGGRFQLPSFGAPEQWEPDLDQNAADTPPKS